MSDEQANGFQQLLLIAIFIGAGVALILNGHESGYWLFIPVVWILMGVL